MRTIPAHGGTGTPRRSSAPCAKRAENKLAAACMLRHWKNHSLPQAPSNTPDGTSPAVEGRALTGGTTSSLATTFFLFRPDISKGNLPGSFSHVGGRRSRPVTRAFPRTIPSTQEKLAGSCAIRPTLGTRAAQISAWDSGSLRVPRPPKGKSLIPEALRNFSVGPTGASA